MKITEAATGGILQKPATLLKKRLRYRYFLVNFCEIFKNTFFTEHLRITASKISLGVLITKLFLNETILTNSIS